MKRISFLIATGMTGAIIFSGCIGSLVGGAGGMDPTSLVDTAQKAKQIFELGKKMYDLAKGNISWEELLSSSDNKDKLKNGQKTDKFIQNLAEAICSYSINTYIKKNNLKEKYSKIAGNAVTTSSVPVTDMDVLLLYPGVKKAVVKSCSSKLENYIRENKEKYFKMLGLEEQNGVVKKTGKGIGRHHKRHHKKHYKKRHSKKKA